MFEYCKVALAHDWLTGMRGGEKVLEVFADLFPDATIHTLLHVPGAVSEAIESHPIRTSALQRMPLAKDKYRYYLPVLPWFAESIRFDPVDLVVSTSSCVAKGIVPPPEAKHACYVHSPMRYIYDRYDDYFSPKRAGWATRCAARLVRPHLQRWDIRSTARVDSMASNSSFVQARVQRIYGRTSRVIHPPVEVERFAAARRSPEDYYLLVAALVPYKNVDLAIEAFRQLDRRLVIVGTGPLLEKLALNCPDNVELRGWVSDADLPDVVAGCRAFLQPNVEDFGIAPVEAMAAGRPIIALGEGGVLDSVRDLDRVEAGHLGNDFAATGLFYYANTPDSLAAAVRRFERHDSAFQPEQIAEWAHQFSRPHFERHIISWLSEFDRGAALPAAA